MAGSKLVVEETYDLRGLNQVMPDMVKPSGESPLAENFRMYARDENDTRVAIRTRKGSQRITVPQGQTLDTQNVATQTGDLSFSTTRIVAQPYTAGASGNLTRLDFEIKKAAGATGHIMVEHRSNNGGVPGDLLGASSILASDVTDTYAYLPAYFIDAPAEVNGTQYWAILYIQDNGSGTYYVRQTADSGALDLESTDEQQSWSSLGASFRFKSYLSTNKGVKGYHRRYPSNSENRTLFAAAGSLYSSNDNGTVAVVDNTLNASSEYVRFDFVDDKSFYCNGIDRPKYWDGSTVTTLSAAPLATSLVKIYQGRAFYLSQKTRFDFSDLYDFNTIPSVNFFYVPSPKSSDPVTGAIGFHDNFVIFTHKTKHLLIGSDLSSFTRKEAEGTKGAVSDEAIVADRNYVYFMSDDGSLNAWNGASDILLSDKIEPEFAAIPDKSKVRLHLYRNQLRVYYPGPTSSENDRRAILDLTYSDFSKRDFRWYVDTDVHITGSLDWNQDAANDLIEFSSRTAWMFRGESGGSDVGKPIDFKYHTAYKTYGSGTSKKRIKKFRPILRIGEAAYTLSVGKDFNFADSPDMRAYLVSGGGAVWGQFIWGDGTLWGKTKMLQRQAGMSGRGEHVQYRFERRGVETPVELYGYVAQVKVGKPK